ncbi:MAG TPA: hydrogenase maturation protease [Gammaproteobacteria bacterium]|nr:hydrogenase maturation protease [Gammaproteobacteria bacterium]
MTGQHVRPVLVFAWGNPSRGDDALGPALLELLAAQQAQGGFPGVELLTDFQLQVEHALDLQGRERVLFVDASVSAAAPCELRPLQPEQDTSYTTHAMSPAAVLAVYEQINDGPPPPAFMLSIRGYEFELGNPLTDQARANLQESYTRACDFLARHSS